MTKYRIWCVDGASDEALFKKIASSNKDWMIKPVSRKTMGQYMTKERLFPYGEVDVVVGYEGPNKMICEDRDGILVVNGYWRYADADYKIVKKDTPSW